MKILHTVESYEPSIGGMQEVVKQISEHLAKMGHQITVATSKNPARTTNTINSVLIKDFDISGKYITGIQGDIHSYQEFLLKSDYDIITNFAAQQWATDLMLPLLQDIKAKKVFVPTGFSALYLPEYFSYFEMMKDWMKLYDMNVFLSDSYQDIEFARKSGVNNLMVIPNGASELEFTREETIDIRNELGISPDHFVILHVGSHTGFKGHSEAIEIFQRSYLKNATLIIVGNVFSKECYKSCKVKETVFLLNPLNHIRKKKLIVCSLNRNQTIALYKASDLFLFPSNIECSPLVLFECMASKTPFLTTNVGNADEIIHWSHGGELMPTTKDDKGYSHAEIQGSINILENIYNDSKKRSTMAILGYRTWQEKFRWDIIAKQYLDLYIAILHKGSSH